MGRYAQNTAVSADKSRAEIEKTLLKYGATGFAYGWQGSTAIVGFEMHGRRIRFLLPLPDKTAPEFLRTSTRNKLRDPAAALAVWEQATRQKWRALALAVKAKLESVESGIASFEEEFMAHIVLPSGETVGQWMLPQIAGAYGSGKMPPLLGYDG